MSQRLWIILAVVVVAVLAFGYFYWPAGTDGTAIVPNGEPETSAPAEEPADAPATTE